MRRAIFKRKAVVALLVCLAVIAAFFAGFSFSEGVSANLRPIVSPTDKAEWSSLGEFDPSYKIDAKYPLARSRIELQFIKPAIATCELALKNGAVIELERVDDQNLKITKSQLFIAPLSIRKRPDWGSIFKSDKGEWSPNNDGADLCDIRNRNAGLIKRPNGVATLSAEHVIDKLDDQAFAWHAHTQSFDFSNEVWSELSGGVFKNIQFDAGYGGTIRFGLTEDEKKALLPYLAQW